MTSDPRKLAILIALLLLSAAVATMTVKRSRVLNPQAGTLREILSTKSDAPDSPQDVIVFTDNTRLEGFGYDIVQVGGLTLAGGSPVYLFKTYSCRGCEPDIKLLVYSSRTKQRFVLPYPGKHVVIDENQNEFPDLEIHAVYGQCEAGPAKLIVASKSRLVDFDGMSVQGGKDWQFSTTTLTWTANGSLTESVTATDSFFTVKRLGESGCKSLDPEDRVDYH